MDPTIKKRINGQAFKFIRKDSSFRCFTAKLSSFDTFGSSFGAPALTCRSLATHARMSDVLFRPRTNLAVSDEDENDIAESRDGRRILVFNPASKTR